MKIRNKVLFANAGILFFFGLVLIGLFPITRNVYVDGQMKEIAHELDERVARGDNIFEVIKYGSDAGHLVITPQRVRGFEIFKPGTDARVVGYEKVSDVEYVVKTSERDLIIRVNDQTLAKFMDHIMKILALSFIVLLIIDGVAIYFIMKSIVQPVQKIEEKLKELVNLEFGHELEVKGKDEFASLSKQINRLDITLSQFIHSRQAFATSLAHELKTPVAVIQSTIDLHQHQVGEYADYAYAKVLIEQNLERISETAKLSLQVFTQKSLFELQTINVAELVQTHIQEWEPLAEKRKLSIETSLKSLMWELDTDSFPLVLSTLFQNIGRYAQEGSVVEVRVDEQGIYIANIVSNTSSSGTQLGLEIARTIALQSNVELKNEYCDDKYVVEILKQIEA